MKNNNKFIEMELTQAIDKIVADGYENLSQEEWLELGMLTRKRRALGNNCYSVYKNCHEDRVKKFLFGSNNPVEPY